MITGENSVKGKLLRKSNRISLCVQTETVPYRYVSVEGAFSIEPIRDGQLLHMATRYLGEEGGRAYAESSTDGDGSSVVVSFTPETWLTVDYNKR